jgi:hypothetical protein
MGLTLEQNKGNAKNLVQNYCKEDLEKIFETVLETNWDSCFEACAGIKEIEKEIENYFGIKFNHKYSR